MIALDVTLSKYYPNTIWKLKLLFRREKQAQVFGIIWIKSSAFTHIKPCTSYILIYYHILHRKSIEMILILTTRSMSNYLLFQEVIINEILEKLIQNEALEITKCFLLEQRKYLDKICPKFMQLDEISHLQFIYVPKMNSSI